MKKNAIFPGSFDPFHSGHREVLRQSHKLFDKIYLIITFNPNKKFSESYLQRFEHIKHATKEFKNVELVINENKLTANVAKELGCNFLIRGLRDSKDLDYEIKMADANTYINDKLITIFFITNKENRKISSSLIKEISNIKKKIEK
ncbi:pantetheine-phosphate adenylyltransferase [Spiroplasma endosymbiont of Aspidapion aeneum]|uniref:pantetheine-phosphate adenylyltransferase n=1 Tax=Spiroplasma endosymbiont of Aspidapion aeneum TaxID=3066276 RepID=UPI00313C5E79